tara:strand:- start:174 stop:488 length:315 start_codon:yes stop_codon:yes gene_type:complete
MTRKIHDSSGIRDATSDEIAEINAREKEWADNSSNRKLELIKEYRLEKLIQTDWWVLRGDITDEQKLYRKNLRDIPTNYNSSKYDELLARDSNGNLTHSVWSKP